MKYITNKRFKKTCLCGQINIPYGTNLQCTNNLICLNDKPICYITSQDAYDYFSRNDDNKGLERGKLIRDIKDKLKNNQSRWNKIWDNEDKLAKFRRQEIKDHWLWNFDFYNAEIEDLQFIYDLIKEV